MKRIKEVYKKLREWWKVPRYRGLMKLALWFLFFLIIFLIIYLGGKIKQDLKEIENEALEDTRQEIKNTEITGYIYNCQINNGMNNINISGTYYNGIDVFNYNNTRYYLKDYIYHYVDNNEETNFDFPIVEYQYNSIKELLKDKEYESKTEYKDGKIEYFYIIDSNTYNSFYQKNYQTEGSVSIKVIYQDDVISSVIIDYSAYFIEHSSYQVIINYSNVNNINGLDINIE